MDERIPARDRLEEELTRLVGAYQGELLKICFMELHDVELARDAVQDTFLKAWQHLGSFRGKSSEKTWLIRIALNCCHDLHRSRWFRYMDRHITLDMLPESGMPFENDDLDFMDALSSLPDKFRRVLTLYYYDNMTVPEISAALRCAKSTVSYRLKHGKEQLRVELRKRGITDV